MAVVFTDSSTKPPSFWKLGQVPENYIWNKVYLRLAYELVMILKWA